jgi:NAD dependent epimerase/dehydratase family protein
LSGKFDFYLSIAHDKGLCALVKRCNPYQIKYDCNIDRRFDNSKINRATNNKLQYTVFAEGINKCLKKFIESPEWRNINWKLNFWMDNITGEKTKIWDADGLKEKARYVKYCIKK